MAKDILKEAIADAKAVREVALANAKAALEEAFTPKLQSMLSAKLSEELNEEEDLDETKDVEETMDEITGMDEKDDMDENYTEGEKEDLDEEIDLEEILNELELEEGEVEEETVDEAKDEDLDEAKKDDDKDDVKEADDKDLDEAKDGKEEEVEEGYQSKMNATADDVQNVTYKSTNMYENEEFDLDTLLEEINNLDENEDEVNEEVEETNEVLSAAVGGIMIGALPLLLVQAAVEKKSPEEQKAWAQRHPKLSNLLGFMSGTYDQMKKGGAPSTKEGLEEEEGKVASDEEMAKAEAELAKMMGENTHQEEIAELKAALEVKSSELNEVNLLNSKLLYVNRIFKANTLDESQKLRVVETLDKADSIKEAKLIYETIKDTFNVTKTSKKMAPKKSIREGLGMASKAAGTSTAPKKPVLNESNDMVARMQKLANIKINQ
jgi:hypothetical protein